MEPLVSIIVPVYKVEAFLDRCVNSLVNQTYRNLEILLIDDGSPDNSGTMCDVWALKDPRIVVFHKPNGGLSDARNYGTERANGQFVTYVDSDDFVADCFIKRFISLQQQHEADVVCCDFVKTYGDDAQYQYDAACHVFTNQEACLALMGQLYLPLVIACCKLYRTQIVREHPFPLGRVHEDDATTCKFLHKANKVVLCEDKLYAYYHNPNSIMNDGKQTNYEVKLWALTARAKYFESVNEPLLANTAWSMNVRFLVDCAIANKQSAAKVATAYISQHSLGRKLNKKTWIKLIAASIVPCLVAWDVKRRIRRKQGHE